MTIPNFNLIEFIARIEKLDVARGYLSICSERNLLNH